MIVDEQAEPVQTIKPFPAVACRPRVFGAPGRIPLLQQQLSRRSLLKTAGWLGALDSIGAARPAFARRDEIDQLSPPSLAQIDAALRDATRARLVPGIVAMAATDKGIIYEGVFGSRHIGQGPAMSRDTVFRIASMIKPVTSVAAMQLVEQGKLKLDEPVPDIDPALGTPQVLTGFDAAGVPQLRPPRQPITLRHLLTHTAGFTYRLWDREALRYRQAIDNPSLRKRAALPPAPLMFDPGTRWQYGTNIDWVGRLVETISGERLDVYFRKHILDPLGMADTGFVVSPAQAAREARLHQRKPDGSLLPQPQEKHVAPQAFSGGAGLYSTAPDYLTLIRMLLHGGSLDGVRILEAETVALMGQNHIGDIEAGILKTTNPALSSDVDFFPGTSLKWGLGHMINMRPGPDGRSAGSLTWGGLLNTYYWIDPTMRVAAVFMTQVLPFADRPTLSLYRRFERGIYSAVKAA
jgi:methyl acetate hydrolase